MSESHTIYIVLYENFPVYLSKIQYIKISIV